MLVSMVDSSMEVSSQLWGWGFRSKVLTVQIVGYQ